MAVRPSRAGPQYLVSWEGYDHTYDTWEPVEHIEDKSLLKKFKASIEVSINLEQPMWQLREAVALRLMGIKRPAASVEIDVPQAALLPVARAILARAAHPRRSIINFFTSGE